MPIKFRGEFEDLKGKFDSLLSKDDWVDLGDNHKQFRHKSGAIVNWYPSTGTISLQGKPKSSKDIEEKIRSILEQKVGDIETEEEVSCSKTYEKVMPVDEGKIKEFSKQMACSYSDKLLGHKYNETEIVIGIVSAVGTDYKRVVGYLKERLSLHDYETQLIHVSSDVIKKVASPSEEPSNEYERIKLYMDLGNRIRKDAEDNSILALGVASEIFSTREREDAEGTAPYVKPHKKKAFIINSLKHPDEVQRLREIYVDGFYLIGIAANENRRMRYLENEKLIDPEEAEKLISRDRDEFEGHGQHTRDTFQLADFFVTLDSNIEKLQGDIRRILDLLFGNPFVTPTFDEFAMFMAFTSSLRSADLSRQVGAVIAKNNEIIATGANDCPRAGGGLYWPVYDEERNEIADVSNGRDYKLGVDSNKNEQQKIVENIIQKLPKEVDGDIVRKAIKKSYLKDITEYGRIVHAEMEALLFCARNNLSVRNSTLYCTTFPCHNCAKHIIAAGIDRVLYVEPYPKSKAFEFYSDAITNNEKSEGHVKFLPFVGVGPRKFFDLFSVSLSSGYPIKRKDKDGIAKAWGPESSKARLQMLPCSYLERETVATTMFESFMRKGER